MSPLFFTGFWINFHVFIFISLSLFFLIGQMKLNTFFMTEINLSRRLCIISAVPHVQWRRPVSAVVKLRLRPRTVEPWLLTLTTEVSGNRRGYYCLQCSCALGKYLCNQNYARVLTPFHPLLSFIF